MHLWFAHDYALPHLVLAVRADFEKDVSETMVDK
jgi:hypothetical protein